MKTIIVIILSAVLSIPGWATTCAKPVAHLLEGTPSPCTGYLFSPEQEERVRGINEQNKIITQIMNAQTKELILYQEKLHVFNQMNTSLIEQINDKERWSMWEKVLYFGLGVAVTGLIVRNVK